MNYWKFKLIKGVFRGTRKNKLQLKPPSQGVFRGTRKNKLQLKPTSQVYSRQVHAGQRGGSGRSQPDFLPLGVPPLGHVRDYGNHARFRHLQVLRNTFSTLVTP